MIRAITALAIATASASSACMDIETSYAPWVPADAITGPLAPEVGPAPLAPPAPPDVLRVASWNVFTGEDPDAIAAEIAGSALATADVIMVQEIEAYPDEAGSRSARLAAALGMTWVYAPARIEGDGTHGEAIFSRFPLVDAQVKQLPHVDQPINERQRIALRAGVVLGDGRTVTVVNVHLDVRLAPVDRIRQLDPAVNDLPELAVLGGDLNTIPWLWIETTIPLTGTEAIVGQDQAQIVDDYLRALGFATPLPPDADTHTFPIDVRLDVVCPRGLPALDAGVGRDVEGSDHWPVYVDVGL